MSRWELARVSASITLMVCDMMKSSNGNIFRVTGPLCGDFIGHHEFPAKASDAELWCFLWFAHWINGWVNNREAGKLRRHRAHYDVIVMNRLLPVIHYVHITHSSILCVNSALCSLTHLGRTTHLWFGKIWHHCFRQWLAAYSVPIQYMIQCSMLSGLLGDSNEIRDRLNAFESVVYKMTGIWQASVS